MSNQLATIPGKPERRFTDFIAWLATDAEPTLQRKAKELSSKDLDKFLLFCIEVDSFWKELANELEPDKDWQTVRDQGLLPILCGGCETEYFYDLLKKYLPKKSLGSFRNPDRPGEIKVILCTEATTQIYWMTPRDPDRLN